MGFYKRSAAAVWQETQKACSKGSEQANLINQAVCHTRDQLIHGYMVGAKRERTGGSPEPHLVMTGREKNV